MSKRKANSLTTLTDVLDPSRPGAEYFRGLSFPIQFSAEDYIALRLDDYLPPFDIWKEWNEWMALFKGCDALQWCLAAKTAPRINKAQVVGLASKRSITSTSSTTVPPPPPPAELSPPQSPAKAPSPSSPAVVPPREPSISYPSSSRSSSSRPSSSTSSGSLSAGAVNRMRSEFSSHFQAYRGASWTLPTGTNVDDVIFRYTLTLGVESALHSFVLVQSRWIEDNFDEKDQEHLRESLESESQPSEPSWPDWMGQELKRFAQTPDGLQDLLSEGWRHLQSTTETTIDQVQLNDLRKRLHLTMLTLSTLFRKFDNKLPETQSESWHTNKLWSSLFDLLDGESDWLRLDTGEICSEASSLRKNRDRDLETRHAPGRKIDGIIVCKKTRHELGAIEAGKTDEGASGTKVLKDGRKITKLLKDMFDNICTTCPRSTDIRKRLRVYGLLVSGPRLEFVSLRYVDGRYYHLKSMKTMTVPTLWDESGILTMLILVKEMLLFKTRLEETAKMILNGTRPVVEELLGNSSASIPPPTHPLTLTTPTSSPKHR